MGMLRRVSGCVLAAAVDVLLASTMISAQTPTHLSVDGVADNHRVVSPTPTFCWDLPGHQTNWQIQVDDDASFGGSERGGERSVWFWDSGLDDKGTAGANHCAVMRQVVKPGFASMSLDRRPENTYWRLRVKADGTWGPWVVSQLRMNQRPLMPDKMLVAQERETSREAAPEAVLMVSGRTYYVSPSGSDANAGISGAPFRTLGHAMKQLERGDVLVVAGGVYEENIVVTTSGGYRSGEAGNPIVVRAAAGEEPVLRAVSTGSRTALQLGPDAKMGHWVFDGLTLGGASTSTGVLLSGVSSITVKRCRFEDTLGAESVGISVAEGSEEIRIEGCRFDRPMAEQLEVRGAGTVEIRSNQFTSFNGRHAVMVRGESAANVLVADNEFRSGTPSRGAVEFAGGAGGSRLVNNVFAGISGKGDPFGILSYRGGGLRVENNVFFGIKGAGVQLNEMSQFGEYRNNIFMMCGRGIDLRGGVRAGSATTGSVVDYNLFHTNGADVVAPESRGLLLLDHPMTGNCLGGTGTENDACDPMFVDAAAGDFRVLGASPAIDAGDPRSPVPIGGGARVDMGRYELGAAGLPYDYQARFFVQDPTPRITWRMMDLDNRLATMIDAMPAGEVDSQRRFQVQIDPRPTFDSRMGGRPLVDSGVTMSAVEGYSVPDSAALAPGEYYVRARQWDTEGSAAGAWSDHNVRIRVSGEPDPPYLAAAWPTAGATAVTPDSALVVHVKDNGSGVNAASVKMYVNGALVEPVASGGPDDYMLTYSPAAPFAAGQTVTVRVVAADLNNSPPGLDSVYSFLVLDDGSRRPPGNVRIGR